MPGMPDLILKAPVFGRFAAASRVPGAKDSPKLQEMIDRLQTNGPNDSLVQIAVDMGFYADPAQAQHVKRDWLNQDPNQAGFWGSTIQTEPIMRAGLLKLCEVFQETGIPIEVLWVYADKEGGKTWEMTISRTRSAIIAIFHTPRVPCPDPRIDSQSMWVVRYNETSGALESRWVKVPQSVNGDQPPADPATIRARARKARKGTKGKKRPAKPKRKSRRRR